MDTQSSGDESQPSGTRSRYSASRAVGANSRKFQKTVDKMTQGLGNVPGRVQGLVAKVPDRVVDIIEQGQKVLTARQPPKSINALLGMLPAVTIDGAWTAEEEQRFQVAFGPYRQFMLSEDAIPPVSNHHYWTMWKTIPRLRNCFPTDIVGPKTHLTYSAHVDIGGVTKPDPRWSAVFCTRLTDLALGSPCGANMSLLALLIRYTVADRLDDRREVPLDDHRTGNRFFDELGARVRSENSARPLRDLHAALRQDWERAGVYLPWESDVMRSIEQLNDAVRSPQPTMPAPGEAFPEYAVETADLTRLARACDQTGDLGHPDISTVEQRAAFLAHARTKQDPLQHRDRHELNSLRVPLVEDQERFKARRVRTGQPQATSAPSPSSDVEMSSGGSLTQGREPDGQDFSMTYDQDLTMTDADDLNTPAFNRFLDRFQSESEGEGEGAGADTESRSGSTFEGFSPREDSPAPALRYPRRGVPAHRRAAIPWDEEDEDGYEIRNPEEGIGYEHRDLRERTQPLNLPNAAARNPASAIGTGTLSEALVANAARIASDIAYAGRLPYNKM
ncbi:hypothetical protein ANO14919_090000 [Xylariales sp. No.14919]|nr:hypothetical protein ANO14919_090000 [Xylariales sp. No.14919]